MEQDGKVHNIWCNTRDLSPINCASCFKEEVAFRRRRWEALGKFTNTKAAQLEAKGWESWLKTLGPQTFTDDFADFHREFWDSYWPVTQKRRRGERLSIDDLVVLYILGRGNGKSSNIEWACIAEGALLGKGYVMYCCATEAQAKDHVMAIQSRLESTQIAAYYPGLASPKVGKHGFRKGWSQEYLATKSGWGIIPIGLDEGVRGGRQDDLRFSLIVLDDIDDFSDSPLQVEKKINTISRGIMPAGTEDTIVLFPQNIIHENSVLNQILTRRSDVLSIRKTIGPYPSFDELELERTEVDGGRVWSIGHCKPHWPAFDIDSARKFLSKFGRNAFLAEYQHDFESAREGRVLRNYNDALMVIDEDDYCRVFGSLDTLDSFNKYFGHDWSRTKSAYHANVGGKLAVTNQNSPLPGKLILHDLMSFEAGTQADDVGLRFLESIAPFVPDKALTWAELIELSLSRQGLEQFISDATRLIEARRNILAGIIPPLVTPLLKAKRYMRFVGSHDQNNDALQVYRRVYGLPFRPLNPKETGGLEWADHYMDVDKKTRHPFFEDRQLQDGTWEKGCPGMFILVKNGKKAYPNSATPDALHDSDLCRYQFSNWRMRPMKLTEAGSIEHGPMKMNDDFGQMLQMLLLDNAITAAPMTYAEQVNEMIPRKNRVEEMRKSSPNGVGLTPEQELTAIISRQFAEKRIRPRVQQFDDWGQPRN